VCAAPTLADAFSYGHNSGRLWQSLATHPIHQQHQQHMDVGALTSANSSQQQQDKYSAPHPTPATPTAYGRCWSTNLCEQLSATAKQARCTRANNSNIIYTLEHHYSLQQ
jgi:hypothetical protein